MFHVQKLLVMEISPKFEYKMNPIMKPEMVRAEIFQFQDFSCYCSEIECKPDWVYTSEESDSETNTKQVVNNMDVVNLQQNLPEDDNCNNVKSTSEIGIQVGLTEEISCMMEFGTNPASGKQILISCIERVKNKRDAHELPADFFPMDEESVLEKQLRTDEDHNCKIKLEDISGEFRNVLDSVQDTIVEDDAISHKSEEEYQPVNPYSTNDHNDIHKIENSGFYCVCGPNYPKQMKHGEKEITQCDEYMDLSRKPVRINSVEEFFKMEGLDHVDFMNQKESKANDVEGKFCDSSETDMPQQGLIFPEVSLEKLFQEEGSLFKGKNQEFSFKMKTHMYSDYVKRPQSWGFYQEKLALILKMFLGCLSIMNGNTRDTVNISGKSVPDRNTSKKDKFGKNEVNCKEDIKFSLLKDITSTWYFFPMFTRFMDFPSSLQTFFERLIRGVPISQAERMSYEWLRLDSFNTLPSSFRGTAIRLAQSGFYYTRQGTRIRCYACNIEHEGWNNTDDPHELHQRISPTCPFLRGNPTYPNYPIIPDTVHSGNTTERSASSATPVTSVIQERTQSRDLETPQFIIPSINTSSTPDLDEVSIPQVEARRESVTTHDSSISQTQQQSNSNPITATSQPETIPSSSSMNHPQQPTDDAENRRDINHGNFVLTIPAKQVEDPGVNPMPQTMSERPKHPEHAPLSSRISSYTSWPVRLDQTPQQMAEAGFFYAGQQNIVIEHAIGLLVADEERKTTAGRQNEAATLHELIQESERLVLHDDCGQQHPLSNTSLPPAPPPTAAAGSFQYDGHQHQDVGGRSSGHQQSGQTNQSTGLGRNASLPQIRQNTSGSLSIAVDVSSSSSFGNQGHQRNNSTEAGGLSAAASLLEPTSLPALGQRGRGIIALPPRPRPRRRITPLPPRPLQNESITMDHTHGM